MGVTVGAPISTTGAGAAGVVAQSIGGGGGLVGSTTYALGGAGAGGAVNLAVNANVSATGAGSTALIAQSQGGTGAAPIAVNIGAVNITGGAGGHALDLAGGTNNTVSNAGNLTTADGQTGLVIVATGGGNNTITNSGYIVGSIDLGSGNNSFTNVNGGIFLAGPIVNLGSGTFTNNGVISPGGVGVVQTLAVTGNLATGAASTYYADLDLKTNLSDQVSATGTASLSGKVIANVMNPGYAIPGTHDAVLVSAAGGITGTPNVTLVAPVSAVATFSLAYPTAKTETLRYVVEFAPAGLTPAETRLGQLIDKIQTAQTSPGFAKTAAALFGIQTVPVLGQVYNSLSGGSVSAAQTVIAVDVSAAHDTVLDQTQSRLGPQAASYSGIDIGRPWIDVRGGFEALDGKEGLAGVHTFNYAVAAGWDYRPTGSSLLGVTVGADSDRYTVSALSTQGRVHSVNVGLYGGLAQGPWTERLDVVYADERIRYQRSMAIPGDVEHASGGGGGGSFSSRLQLARAFKVQSVGLIQPFVAVEVSNLHLNGFTEGSTNGAGATGALNLAVAGRSILDTRTLLGSELSGAIVLGRGLTLVSSLKATWIHDYDVDRFASVGFAQAPGYGFDSYSAPAAQDLGRIDLRASLRTPLYEIQFSLGGYAASRVDGYDGEAGIRFHW